MKPLVRQAMRDAYAASDADRAHKMLTQRGSTAAGAAIRASAVYGF
jgi:hypothetical protein